MNELDVELRDGRTLHVYDDGDPGGLVVVVHHGTPSSGLPYAPDSQRARERGLRLISYDRAGYGAKQALEIASDLHITDDRVDQARKLAQFIEEERAKLQARQTTVRRMDRE